MVVQWHLWRARAVPQVAWLENHIGEDSGVDRADPTWGVTRTMTRTSGVRMITMRTLPFLSCVTTGSPDHITWNQHEVSCVLCPGKLLAPTEKVTHGPLGSSAFKIMIQFIKIPLKNNLKFF